MKFAMAKLGCFYGMLFVVGVFMALASDTETRSSDVESVNAGDPATGDANTPGHRDSTRSARRRDRDDPLRRRYDGPPVSDEKRLGKHLLDRYRRLGESGRPLVNSSRAVSVMFGLAMIQMGLDERDNTLTISVWCRYRWVDEYLTWNPDEYGGTKSVRLSSNKVWIPDIMLYNTADTHKLEREVLVVVSHNGSVLWIPHRIYRSSCSVDVTHFPFDHQTCHMTFGSWAYHGNEIDLRFFEDLERMDISDLERENTEWDITAKREKRKIQYYDCCTEPYVTLIFTLELKRKLVFSSVILTLPCIFLAFMTLVVFWLPPERPDRTSLAMNLFASFLLLLLILVEAAPPTASSVPKLGVYYCFNMVLIMLSIFLSSVVINVSRRGETLHPVPNWLRAISLNGLAKICCTRYAVRPNRSPMRRRYGADSKDDSRPRSALFINQDALGESLSDVNSHGVGPTEPYITASLRHTVIPGSGPSSTPETKMFHSHFLVVQKQLKAMECVLQDILLSLLDKNSNKELRELRVQWQIIAVILDRVFFFLFCWAIVLSLFFLFPTPF